MTTPLTQQQFAPSPQPVRTTLSRRDAMRRLATGGLALGAAVTLARHPARAQGSPDPAGTEAAVHRAINALNQALATGEMRLLEEALPPATSPTPPTAPSPPAGSSAPTAPAFQPA